MKKNNEVKLGMFVTISIIILCSMIVFFGNFDILKNTYEVRVQFNYASGVMADAPVRYAGVEIGKVKDIKILKQGLKVELLLNIDEDIILREDVKIFINSLGVMGEKYIEFRGGTSEKGMIKDIDYPLTGVDPIPMDQMFNMGQNIAEELKGLIISFRNVIDDEKMVIELREIVSNTKDWTLNLKELTTELNSLISKNKEPLTQAIDKMRKSADVFHEDLSVMRNVLKKIDEGEGSFGKFINEDQIYTDIEYFVKDIKENPWKLLIKTRPKRVKIKTKLVKIEDKDKNKEEDKSRDRRRRRI